MAVIVDAVRGTWSMPNRSMKVVGDTADVFIVSSVLPTLSVSESSLTVGSFGSSASRTFEARASSSESLSLSASRATKSAVASVAACSFVLRLAA